MSRWCQGLECSRRGCSSDIVRNGIRSLSPSVPLDCRLSLGNTSNEPGTIPAGRMKSPRNRAMQAATDLFRAASRPFENALAMPPSVYTSAAFLQRELETVFAHEWICVGRANSLGKPGDYL